MFVLTQVIGLAMVSYYSKDFSKLPFGTSPPEGTNPGTNVISIFISIAIAVTIILLLMKFRSELFLRIWFFAVVTLALGISFNAIFSFSQYSQYIALAVAIPLAIVKIFKRNIIVHNLTELLIYPGIAVIFIPLLNIWTGVLLLLLLSAYDMYAVWHSGFMQKMAKYQIEKVRVFSGFLIPYISSKDKAKMISVSKSKSKSKNAKQIKVPVAVLGGGDVVFPIIFAGLILISLGLLSAILVSVGASIALFILFYFAEKGKAYPAMPFITLGCFVGLGFAYLVF